MIRRRFKETAFRLLFLHLAEAFTICVNRLDFWFASSLEILIKAYILTHASLSQAAILLTEYFSRFSCCCSHQFSTCSYNSVRTLRIR